MERRILSLAAPLSDTSLASLTACGSVLSTVAAAGEGISRAALAEATNLSRMTLAQRLSVLQAAGLVREEGSAVPSGGRPTRLLGLDPGAGVLLTADMGETHMRLAVTDLAPAVLIQELVPFSIADGPEAAMERLAMGFGRLLANLGGRRFVAAIGLSLPAPVDHRLGRVYGPSILTGWDDFPLGDWLRVRYDAPVAAENDVNLLAIFEHRRLPERPDDFLFVKMGTGIGSGIVANGRLQRGARGASGDIGHMQFLEPGAPLCRCGKIGCFEARAAGWALARDLRAQGLEARDARDVIAHVEAGRPEALALVRAAGAAAGEALGHVVAVLNPERIVIGGTLARAGEVLLRPIRETVARRCLPLAVRDLTITAALPVPEASLIGAAHCARELALSSAGVDPFLVRYRQWLEAA
ncbi:ROK family protein [Aureimonas sp. N4]|uniref:ROK family protein n=1 Tax=Aureimonas sp. N4 TaxID=1638165 RepID=UPI00078555EF|nr:ROK family protein [Aureimonas sp. N4]